MSFTPPLLRFRQRQAPAPESDAYSPESFPGGLPPVPDGCCYGDPLPYVSKGQCDAQVREAFRQGTRAGWLTWLILGYLAGALTVAAAFALGYRGGF